MSKPENVTCPECGAPMRPKTGKFGVFWSCVQYPGCRGTRNSDGEARRSSSDPEPAAGDETSPSERWRSRDRGRWRD